MPPIVWVKGSHPYPATADFNQGGPITPSITEGLDRHSNAATDYQRAIRTLDGCRMMVFASAGLQIAYSVTPLALGSVPGAELKGYVL